MKLDITVTEVRTNLPGLTEQKEPDFVGHLPQCPSVPVSHWAESDHAHGMDMLMPTMPVVGGSAMELERVWRTDSCCWGSSFWPTHTPGASFKIRSSFVLQTPEQLEPVRGSSEAHLLFSVAGLKETDSCAHIWNSRALGWASECHPKELFQLHHLSQMSWGGTVRVVFWKPCCISDRFTNTDEVIDCF